MYPLSLRSRAGICRAPGSGPHLLLGRHRPDWVAVIRPLLSLLLLTATLNAQVGLDSTREDVIAHFGLPRGSSKAGDREILSYAGGRVVLDGGRVTDMDMRLEPAPAAAAPVEPVAPPVAPAMPVAKSVVPPPVRDPWFTNIEEAKAAAVAGNKRILVLFTGTDWCPPCQTFQAEVAYDADFHRIFSTSFVFLKVDWLRNRSQPEAEAERVTALRRHYGIAIFPTLMVLGADGTQLMRVDTRKGRVADGTADFFIQAIDEARQATRDGKPVTTSWWPF